MTQQQVRWTPTYCTSHLPVHLSVEAYSSRQLLVIWEFVSYWCVILIYNNRALYQAYTAAIRNYSYYYLLIVFTRCLRAGAALSCVPDMILRVSLPGTAVVGVVSRKMTVSCRLEMRRLYGCAALGCSEFVCVLARAHSLHLSRFVSVGQPTIHGLNIHSFDWESVVEQ